MRRTPEEIQVMLTKLRRLKAVLPEYSSFGDANHAVIDAQVDVLEGRIFDEDEIWDKKEALALNDFQISEVVNALSWLDGEIEDEELVSEDDLNR